MKLIDLLNKIANNEEVPKKIKHQYYDYEWNTIDKDYQTRDGEMLLGNMNIQYHLNDEIILIEDEEIDIQEIDTTTLSNRKLLEVIAQAVKQIDKKLKEKE